MTRAGRIRAIQEAEDLVRRLGIDAAKPVDPFQIIDRLGLELRFPELGSLLGAIVPADPPHVLINSRRPASLQRYTAAHEVGHWILDQDRLSMDLDEQVQGVPATDRERNAQLFAATLLMPLELVYATAEQYGGLAGGAVTPALAYNLARDMHVSYQATVQRLHSMSLVSDAQRRNLLRTAPATVKQQLLAGSRPADPRKDVWLLEPGKDRDEVEVFQGDEIVITLPESPSTGYTWDPILTHWDLRPAGENGLETFGEGEPPTVALDVLATSSRSEEVGVVGGTVDRHVGVVASVPGDWELHMHNRRPFAPDDDPETVVVQMKVRPSPDVEARARWVAEFKAEDARLSHIEERGDER